MRAAARVALAGLALAAVALAVLSWWLPRWLAGEGVAARLRAAVHEATGHPASWEALELRVLPPRVVLREGRLGEPAAPGGAPLSVARAELDLALWPLLARAVVVERVEIEGASLRLARTPAGFALAGGEAAARPPASHTGESQPPQAPPRDTPPRRTAERPASGDAPAASALRFALRRVVLREGRLALEDHTVRPPARLELAEVAGEARAFAPDAPIALSAAGRLAAGGTLRLDGEVTPGGPLALDLALEGVDLAPLAPLVADAGALAGRASGTLRLSGPSAAPDALDAELELADAALRLGEIEARGPLGLRAALRGDLARPQGSFSLDASRAELLYGGGAFRKPPGVAALAEGRLAAGPDGRIALESVRVQVRNLGGAGSFVPTPNGGRLAFEAPAFDLSGWGELVPALAPLAPDGPLRLAGARVAWRPLGLGGRAVLDGVRLRPGGRGPVELRGELVGAGAGLRGEALSLLVGGQHGALSLDLLALDTDPRHRAHLELERADAGALLGALAGRPDALEGPLSLVADVAGPLAAGPRATRELRGRVRLEAGPGRIPDLSPLAAALERLGPVGQALREGRRGQRLERFTGDRFERLSGHFELAGGRARTDDLELRYPGYGLGIVGAVGLADGRLDARGRLRLEPELAAALAGENEATGPARELPLARVGGTIEAPELVLEEGAALATIGAVAGAARRDRLERKLDRALGEGAGRGLLDALDGFLGGPAREEGR